MTSPHSSVNGRRRFHNVTSGEPCPICKKPDQCSLSDDGDLCVCFRVAGPGPAKTTKDGRTYWVHRLRPAPPPCEPRYSLASGGGRLADPDIRHRIYDALLGTLHLSRQHRSDLEARGLKAGLMGTGYRSLPERGRSSAVRRLIETGLEEHLPTVPGFFVAEHGGGKYWTVGGRAGLLIPGRDAQGRIVGLLIRPDDQGGGGKYVWLSSKRRGGSGPGAPIHVPLRHGLKDTSVVRVTEGALKADVATRLSGVLTIGLPGVGRWTWAPRVLQELGAQRVRVALDADACRKRAVGAALQSLTRRLLDRGFAVELELWDESEGKGIDDLLARGGQPEIIAGERVPIVAERIAEAAAKADPPGDGGNGGAAEAGTGRTGAEIILCHFKERYRPTFRRAGVLSSEALCREVGHAEACLAPSTELLNQLAGARDAPRNDNGVIRSALPKFFKTWAPVAWRDLLDQLQEEEQTAEIVQSAADEFRAKVAAGLHTHVALGYRHQGEQETRVERRSLISWANLFAKAGGWAQVRNYLLWCRRDSQAEGNSLRIALRVGLFTSGQAYQRSLAELSQYAFARKCQLYGVGTAQRAGGERVVELAVEFLAELLTAPEAAQPAQPAEAAPSREPGEDG